MALALFSTTLFSTTLLAQTQAPDPAAVAAGPYVFDPLANPLPIDPFEAGILTNYQEEMRAFVRSISDYARTLNPKFVIIAQDGLSLVNKTDLNDDTLSFPARAYMRSIDGVLETNLLDETVTNALGKVSPDLESELVRKKARVVTAKSYGLKIFNMEYSSDGAAVNKLYQESAAQGYVPFVAETQELMSIPKNPAAIYKANAANISTTTEMRNYLYVANSQAFGATRDYLLTLRQTNFDALIIDVMHGRMPLSRQDINVLKYKKLGSRRLVLAEIDISSASSFHYYWLNGWRQGNPPFVYAPFREDPDRYRAVYWDSGWQAVISGNVNSYLYGLIALGFDGVVLKGVEAWKFYETGGEAQ